MSITKTSTNQTGKGYFNLMVTMKNGDKRKLGGILDYDKLGKKERQLLETLHKLGKTAVNLTVEYNAFDDSKETKINAEDF